VSAVRSVSQFGKGLLRRLYVSGLQCLPDGCEVILALADPELPAAAEGAILSKILNGGEFLTSRRQIAGLKCLA
jgi:hypothetical protein